MRYLSKPIRGTQLNKAHPLAQGLVGCWLFNESAGNKVVDLSGVIGDGVKGSTVSWEKGELKSSSVYDDANSVISLAEPDLTTWRGVSVVSEFVFNGALGEYPGIATCLPSGEFVGGFSFAIDQDYLFFFRAGDSSTRVDMSVQNGEKITACGTWNKTTLKMYSGGVLQGSPVTQGSGFTTSNIMNLCGYERSGWRTPRNVPVKYIYIYNRALSATEVASLYADPYQIFQPSFEISNIVSGVTITATISGSVVTGGVTESEIVTGGETIIITLTGDTWVAAGTAFDAQRQAILDGLVSAQNELTGWNNEVKPPVTAVVRTSDTVVTITV